MNLRDIDDVFNCMQKLKYQDKKHSNNSKGFTVKSVEDIKHHLKRRQCYLEFSIAPKPFVLIITKEQCELVEIKATNLDVIQFTESIINRDFSAFTKASIQLGKILLKSIEVSNFDKLFITSSGWFLHIPFQSLLVSSKNIEKKDYQHWIIY